MQSLEIRRRIEELRAAGSGRGRRGFPAELKRAAANYWRSRRGRGASRQLVAQELGVPPQTLERWERECSARPSAPAEAMFHEVRVVEATRSDAKVVVSCRNGLVIEGLSIEQLAELVKRLS